MPRANTYCKCCHKPTVVGNEPLARTCLGCCIAFERMKQAHAMTDNYTASPFGQEERVERYAAIVAAGGRLFE